MRPFEDPTNEGNCDGRYMTGKSCIVAGCQQPAGTAWSPLFCVPCNINRMNEIEAVYRAVDQAVAGAANVQ